MKGRRVVIPDVHGCARTLQHVIQQLRVGATDHLFLLGDIIDRGPRSKEVIDLIFDLSRRGIAVTCLRGNHEQMLLDSVDAPEAATTMWLVNGGHTTLDSFQARQAADIPYRYLSFIRGLPYYVRMDDFILVHASLNFRAADPFSDTRTMLWERPQKKDHPPLDGRRIICGHTPATRDAIRNSLQTNFICLDNGCVYRQEPDYGMLATLELNSLELQFHHNID